MKTLMPADAFELFEFRNVGNIVARAADEKGEIAEHAMPRAVHFIGQRLGGSGQRLRVRHFEDGSDAARDRSTAAGFEIFLVLEARLAEMHLRVDDAGQDVQARGIDRLCSFCRSERRRLRRSVRPKPRYRGRLRHHD